MLKKILITLMILASIVLLAVGIGGYLVYRQIENIKQPLIDTLQSYIDGEIKIEEAEVSLYPLGVSLKSLELYAPEAESPATTIEQAYLKFDLFPLIQKKIRTTLVIVRPQIYLVKDKSGKSNMEKIFAPLIDEEESETEGPAPSPLWKSLEVQRLQIREARFISSGENAHKLTELKNIDIDAKDIHFRSQKPAQIKLQFEDPSLAKAPFKISAKLGLDRIEEKIDFTEGKFSLADLHADWEGEALLPKNHQDDVKTKKRSKKKKKAEQDIELKLKYRVASFNLAKLSKILNKPLPVSGNLQMSGTVSGSPFAPVIGSSLYSSQLQASGRSLSNFKANLVKAGDQVKINQASFGIFGGSIGVSGVLVPKKTTAADLAVKLSSLNLAAISGKDAGIGNLNGNLKVRNGNISHTAGWSGGGSISMGPIKIPEKSYQGQVKVAKVATAGTALSKIVNLDMLSSSSRLIGTQIPQLKANLSFGGGGVSLKSFNMQNGNFSAGGAGKIIAMKTLDIAGNFTLNSQVTAKVFPDKQIRSFVTKGKGVLSVPFTATGPLSAPDIKPNFSSLNAQLAKASALGIAKLLEGGLDPNKMIDQAIKNSPLNDPKNPLGQILQQQLTPSTQPKSSSSNPKTQPKSSSSQPARQPRSTTQQRNKTQQGTSVRTRPSSKNKSTQDQKKPSSGNQLMDQLLGL